MRYLILLITGFILLACSLYKLKIRMDFVEKSELAVGTVSKMVEDDGAYYPVFTVNGVTYHHHSGSNPASWKVGDRAEFLYDPAQPSVVIRNAYFDLFGWSIFYIVVAIPLIIIGGGYYLLNPRRYFPKETIS